MNTDLFLNFLLFVLIILVLVMIVAFIKIIRRRTHTHRFDSLKGELKSGTGIYFLDRAAQLRIKKGYYSEKNQFDSKKRDP